MMIKAGFDVRTEPYLHNILLCLRAHLLQACTCWGPVITCPWLEEPHSKMIQFKGKLVPACSTSSFSQFFLHMRHVPRVEAV